MTDRSNLISLFTNRTPQKQGKFDITLLPLNLSEGRNIGDLSGLYLFTAPKKTETSREADILIVLFHVDNMHVPEVRLNEWANILSDAYFSARGSFTMGVTAAVKQLALFLSKETKGQIFPTIFMNAAVLRDRSVLLAHAGPVHSTIISADHVQNFNNQTSLPIQANNNELSFFTADVSSEDIILLCPRVPHDWTNSSIMEVTGDSPLNAIRFLLDRSGGNLQAAVIQLKAGKGKVSFRTKPTITANVQPSYSEKEEIPGQRRRRSSDVITPYSEELPSGIIRTDAPLLRQRNNSEFFREFGNQQPKMDSHENDEKTASPDDSVSDETTRNDTSLTGERELPGSGSVPYRFTELTDDGPVKKPKDTVSSSRIKRKNKPEKKDKKAGKAPRQLNFGRLLLYLFCGLMIPIIVVSALFFVYSGRSKSQLHREYLTKAVDTAQTAIQETDLKEQEALWTKVVSYTELAMNYGSSPAARDLLRESMQRIDSINGGIQTVYTYANSSKLPQNMNITEFAASGQYTYALDSTSGSVLRFVSSGTGLSLDNSFTCIPGNYPELGKENSSVQVGALVDFVILPSGSPHGFIAAGVDADGNVLYCSGYKSSQSGKLQKPATEKFMVKALTFYENAMYVLDTQASAVWEYIYSNADGFSYEPTNYYGSYSPYLSDVTDFSMYKEYSYFLRSNGTLLLCDFTGYRPDCRDITNIQNPNGTNYLDFSLHHFSKIMMNSSPDNSVYIMDSKMQSVLNLSAKANFIRYIVPNRSIEEISQFSNATAFGITGQNRLLWGFNNDLYIGNMP